MRADLEGSTALYKAAETGRLPMVRQLMERGADINLPGAAASRRFPPRPTWAVRRSCELFIDNGADPKAMDSTQKTAIVYAAGRGFSRIVRLLLDHGVDINADTATI